MSHEPAFRPFALKRPCSNCPFRSDRLPFLSRERAQDIADSLEADASFHCHKTISYDTDDGGPEITETSKHCAGAMITMELEGKANQMMRIGERMGLYSREDLQLDSPVFPTLADWVAAHP
ncbi:conserved hypothetical protein (plasmid) [Pseudarthrobacter chlorophenolicus A6]|uniref:Uncharacterized protein n=1 Tax=Pseudarthrobacter chlorophenolicus (strain ATCC 700700 / DSM 12829 / CIP 107037 / JCM 12360 / KCTC 9906 / NCIMB 13794 / A6) TaxID=452863 RepID=B8HI07_PSECP|nr:hypothetical protein [Pseudarthrobacter chlorophenolicus]ACL42054.1 conserved hypothetical protein [Pseudarthrobacter chlorophenolicus A6]SDQ20917.1 hypothetical protein SAMN04489738_0753 [Pseudarthrobacter chlorophenolicus]